MIKKVIAASLGKHKFRLIFLIVTVAAAVLLELAPAVVLQKIIDGYLTAPTELIKIKKYLFMWAAAYFGIILASGVSEFFKQLMLIKTGESITAEMKKAMIDKLQVINPRYFANTDPGVTSSVIINDVETVNLLFTDGVVSLIIDLLKIIGIVVAMFIFDLGFGLITVAVIPVIWIITETVRKAMLKAQSENRKYISIINNRVYETYQIHKLIGIYSEEKRTAENFENLLDKNYRTVEKVNFCDSVYSPIIKVLSAVIIAAVMIMSFKGAPVFGVTAGALAGGVKLIESLFSPIDGLGMELQTIEKASAGIKRVKAFFAEKDEENKLELKVGDIISDNKAEIIFDNVSFSYDGKRNVLENFSLTVKPLEKIVFMGRTGEGKTTLFRLIDGALKPDKGRITINGVDAYKIPDKIKSSLMGYVEQGFRMIEGTVKDNITVYNDVQDKKVTEILNAVCLNDKISGMQEGINTVFKISDFSEGELQLLCIARALVLTPPVLLLDEVTANLDSVTEKTVLGIIEKISGDRTAISVSHRLSTASSCGRIVILKNGKPEKILSPKELGESEYYSDLKSEQLGWKS